jgi:crotonobetainyl-CoA:carnitine CoA-transferase CaiB-like acyl-CoA transferase
MTEQATAAAQPKPGTLDGLRVVEFADELGEYCGLLLAAQGAEVIKIEPPEGAPTRRIGPFHEDRPGPERSLYFWAHNRGKRSIMCDMATPDGRATALSLIESADIVLDSLGSATGAALGLGEDTGALRRRFPHLIHARITPFGDSGPWKDFRSSDLVHLALGGIMMNCGYNPDPAGHYDLPPIAPQLWHAYYITGDQMHVAILAALVHRERTGEGQDISCAVHEAVSKNTESDVMSWIMRRQPLFRQTCSHATEWPSPAPPISHTKDGRWQMNISIGARDEAKLIPYLDSYGAAADLKGEGTEAHVGPRQVPGTGQSNLRAMHSLDVIQRFVRQFTYEKLPWREAQDAGLLWAPLRKPHENTLDEHWRIRATFSEIEHPELGRSFTYPTSRWISTATAWRAGRRAPLIGEDTGALCQEPHARPKPRPVLPSAAPPRLSAHGKPFPLQGVRILDFSWFLASAGGTRFCAGLGAESFKVEWKGNPDTRLAAMAPVGGRAAREAATAPLEGVTDPDMGGQFNNKNAGKRGLSLNIRKPEGLKIAQQLIGVCDVVAEGFSPGVLDRLGLGYEAQKAIRPDIIYVQQSGMGSRGVYGRFRTVGPVAASFAGISEMSGMPEPAMPAGWGYSYLDWIGAYSFAAAIVGAVYHRQRTGEGQMIDSSQCESGIFLTGVPVLDWSANERPWQRIGNRSPYKPAAPHGAFRCKGEDRWLAIACFDDAQWRALAEVAGNPAWADDPRFASLPGRLAHQDALELAVGGWTAGEEDYALMYRLQAAGVPAGVCQTAEDRCDHDPQLKALGWLTEVNGTKIGRWPVPELPMKLSESPAHIGGPIGRGAPCYGEDNEYILGELLGYSTADIRRFAEEDII